MLSELEKELGRVRYGQERSIFELLDRFFDDPSDENLSELQKLRHDHKESVTALDKARRARRDQEKAAENAAKVTAAASSIVSSPSFTGIKASATEEMEQRIKELQEKAEARIEALREQEQKIAAAEKRAAGVGESWWKKFLG